MRTFTVVLVVSSFVGYSHAGYRFNSRDTTQYGAFQGPCEYDEDCLTRNAFCKSNRLCDCKRQFEYDERSDTCFPTTLGLRCYADADCSSLPNSVCKDERCQCRPAHVVPDGQPDSSCLPARQLMANCEDDAQCRATDQFSHCNVTARHCDCNVGYHTGWTRGQCIKNKGIREACNSHDECAAVQDQRSKVECRRDNSDNVNKCFCREGFGADASKNNMCIEGYSGDGSTIRPLLLTATLAVAVSIFQRL